MRYPLELSAEESAAGFEVGEVVSGVHAVVRELGGGLRAVKRAGKERVEYVVCDGDGHPLYPPAASLDELEARFGRPQRTTDADAILLLDNLQLVFAGLSELALEGDAGKLFADARAHEVAIKQWWRTPPSTAVRAATKREVLALTGALAKLRSELAQSEQSAMKLTRVHEAVLAVLTAAGEPVPEESLRQQVAIRTPVVAATWTRFLRSSSAFVLLTDGRVALLPRDVPGGEAAMADTQYEAVRLLRIAKKPLALRDLSALLRQRKHPSGAWATPLPRSVLALDRRLVATATSVSLVTLK